MNNINNKQNNDKILKYLFTQRYLYKVCKRISVFIICVSAFVWILGIIPCSSETFSNFKLIVTALGTLIVIIAEVADGKERSLAVDYQEYIDRSLFEFKIDKSIIQNILKLDNNADEIIIRKKVEYEKAINPEYKFSIYNWYTDVSQLPLDIARIICQNENIRWENRQRKQYSKILIIIIIVLIIITYIKTCILGESYLNIITVIPMAGGMIRTIIKNEKVIKSINDAEEIISGLYMEIEQKGEEYSKENIKEDSLQVQSIIRSYRLNNTSIPDWIYKKMKVKEQKKSSEFVKLKIQEILNNIVK